MDLVAKRDDIIVGSADRAISAPRSPEVQPRTTLLDALRDRLDVTAAKRVFDRGTCGACTVLKDGEPIYGCMMLAVDANGLPITTAAGLTNNGKLSDVQQAFVDHDGLMCGFCTPGFVTSVSAALVELVQKCVASRFYDRGRYSPARETGTHHFHQMIAQAMG